MRTLATLLATLSLALVACGGDESAGDALAETAARLGEIRSGTITMTLLTRAEGGGQAGFELQGPFSLESKGPLPLADIEVTQIAGSERGTTHFLATGEKAFLEVEGTMYELAPDEFVTAREASPDESPLAELRIEDWFIDPELSSGGEVDGTETDRVRAQLDVVAALNDLVVVARELGDVPLSPVEGPNAARVERSLDSAVIEVHTGAQDRLLRRLVMEVDFGLDAPNDVREALAGFAGGEVSFELELADVNEPVSVEEPTDAVPFQG